MGKKTNRRKKGATLALTAAVFALHLITAIITIVFVSLLMSIMREEE